MTRKQLARLAGILYLGNILTGMFSELVVRAGLVVPGDSAATAAKIMGSQTLFRIGVISDLVMMVLFLLFPYCLFVLLKPVGEHAARLMMYLVVIGVAILSLNLLNSIAPLMLLGNSDSLQAFSVGQRNALALFFMEMHAFGYSLAAISYGTWLMPVGYLVWKSGLFPRILGPLLIAGGCGHLSELAQKILAPDRQAWSYPGLGIAILAEISFCLWLLIKAVENPKSTENPPDSERLAHA